MSDYLNSTRRSVAFFKKAHEDGRLQIKPPFQRNPVWTELQKSFLIDSILRGYPIPELYVQDLVDQAGEEQHVIVDGQQRVRACLEFVEGKFALHPDEVPQWPDMAFEDLTPDERQRIFAYNFIVRQLPPVAEEELRAIFKRLNRNTVVLNQQELRHATYKGEFITTVEALADLEWWSTSGVFTPNDVRRMLDVEFVAELTIGFLHGPQNKKLTLEKWFETYETSFPDKDKVSAMFPKVLGEMTQTVSDFPKTRWRKKSDFYSLFLLFASHETALPLSKTARKEASRLLHRFADVVDKYLAQRGSAPKLITEYAEAVERAASDLGNRKALQRSPELTRGRSPEVDHPEFPPMTRASADAHEASLPHLPSLVCAGPPCWPSAARVFGVGLSDRSSRADASVVAST